MKGQKQEISQNSLRVADRLGTKSKLEEQTYIGIVK